MRRKSILTVAILLVVLTILPMVSPQKAAANSKFADGEHSIPFVVLKDTGSEQSATAEYVVSPAKVIIQNGKTHVVMTLNNSSWWQYFKVNSSDVQVLSDNGDKRIVKFPIQDIEQLVNAKIHIIVTGIPGFNYDNKYDIRFKFNTANIPLASVPEKPVTPTTPPPATSTPDKVVTKPSTNPTEKPAEKQEEKKQEVAPKTEEKKTESSEAPKNEKEEEPVEPTDKVEPSEEDLADEESKEIEEDEEEKIEVEEPAETMDEQVTEELESESKSNTGMTLLIVIILVIVAGGVFLFVSKKRSRTPK